MKIGEIPRFLHKNLQFFKNITEGSVELKKNICNIYKNFSSNPLYIVHCENAIHLLSRH